jgi:hypothetical protein
MVHYNTDWHAAQLPPPARPKWVPGGKGVMSRADTELSAMQAIAAALSALPDVEARTRVLRWAAEHFDANVTPSVTQEQPVQPTAAPQAPQASEGDVDPLNLDTIFDDGSAPTFDTKTPLRPAKPPVVTALHNFVADFQKLARDWQSA